MTKTAIRIFAVLCGCVAWMRGAAPCAAQAPNSFSEIAVEQKQSSGADLFAIDAESNIWHVWQNDDAGHWGGLEHLDGLGKDVAVVLRDDGRFEVFAVGTDDAVWHDVQQKSGWGGWESLGGSAKRIAVAKTKAGRFGLFIIGIDDAVWQRTRTGPNGKFTAWQSLGGTAKRLAVAEADGGTFRVFAIGSDDAIWHSSSRKPDWQTLGGIGSAIAVTRPADGRLEVCHVGTDAGIYCARQNARGSSFADWQSVGGNGARCALNNVSNKRATLVALAPDGRSLGYATTVRGKAAAASGWSEWRSDPGPFPRDSSFKGTAQVEIPDLHVSESRSVVLGMRFEPAQSSATITRFPPLVTKRFHTPFGNSACTVTLVHGGTGSYDPGTGQIKIPVTLKFDQSLDVPGVEEDTRLEVELRSDREGGAPFDAASGRVALVGSGKFTGKGAINPLKNKKCEMRIEGVVSP
jgi:hypothetical protein